MLDTENHLDFNILSVISLSWENKQAYAKARPYNALSLRLSGGADFIHNKNEYKAEQGSLIFVPSDYEYTIKPYRAEEVIVIHFDIIKTKFEDIKVLNPSNSEVFVALFKSAYKVWLNKPVGYCHKLYSIFYSILENIEIQKKDVALSSTTNLQNVINYINSNFSDSSLCVEDLARYCNVSATYFRKLFYKNLAVSPLQYLTDLRIKHATSLLRSGYYSVEEAAYRSGYENVKYFSSLYKKIYGIPPSKVKNSK